ncbi:hypothetical protein Tco_0604744 [Tanacetum coccineum]
MTTIAEFMILSSGDNRPPMLEKPLYDSWKSRMELYMQNRENERIILESVKHGPLIWPTIEENGVTRTKKYVELSATEKIQVDYDLKETNIIFQGLPSDVYSLVNHHRVAKDLWERVKLLMQVHQDACPQPQSIPQIEYTVSIVNQQTYLVEFPQIDSGLAVHVFKQGDDLIDAINKMMSWEGHMARQCPKPKRKRDATYFRDKVLLVEAQGSGNVLNKEELAFLADPRVAEVDSDCDEISTTKAVLMANLSSYGSDVLFEFLGTVKFGNDHIAKIMGYGDYQIGNAIISRVYYVEGLGYHLFSVGQFCDQS